MQRQLDKLEEVRVAEVNRAPLRNHYSTEVVCSCLQENCLPSPLGYRNSPVSWEGVRVLLSDTSAGLVFVGACIGGLIEPGSS